MTMDHPPPDHTALLPPLLACLPAAFMSSTPPPPLLELLSPILEQRVQIFSESPNGPAKTPWLLVLCWNSEAASELVSIVKSTTFESHPVSGEIELGEVSPPQYRRLDEETLQSRLLARDFGLQIIYLWCEGKKLNKGPSWKLFELLPLDSSTRNCRAPWCATIEEADQGLEESSPVETIKTSAPTDPLTTSGISDDDYWARYDGTPLATSAIERSASLIPSIESKSEITSETISDEEYLNKYGEVQPEMDNNDGSIDPSAVGACSLDGNITTALAQSRQRQRILTEEEYIARDRLIHTRPSSSSSIVVAQLEKAVRSQPEVEIVKRAAQQHISTTMKSLFRLAKGIGITREEFERIVRTELGVLSMLENDD